MGAMQKFFSYYGVTLCGIPEITLLGTTEDWKSVRDRASALAEYDLEWWTRELLPILDQFIAASEGRVDADFWKSIYKVQGGSGGPYISGWIVDLFPYLTKGHDGTQWRDAPVRNPFLGGATRGIRRGPTTDGFVVGVYAKIELCMSSKHDRRRALRAERAALRWARTQWPSTGPESVYCTDRMPDDQLCYINDPNHVTWAIICDDDYPHANDGCEVGRLERAEVFKPLPDAGVSATRR